jgi:predicted XRE-type DNA-binding protein
MARRTDSALIQGSGNVFADIGVANAEEKRAKVQLAVAINRMIVERRYSQKVAARTLGVNQPKISALQNYRLAGFSVERLMKFLTALDCDVNIVIRPRPKSRKRTRAWVSAASHRLNG